MNKNKLFGMFFLGVLMFLCLASLGLAAVEVTEGLTENKVVFNFDYGSLGENDDDTETLEFSQSLKFTNTGELAEEVSLGLSDVLNGYNLELLDDAGVALEGAFTLGASGAEDNSDVKSVTLKAVVPIDKDSGEYTIGKLKFADKEFLIESVVASMLDIEEIKVYVNGVKEDTISSSGKKVENIRPGSKVELIFELENTFDDNYNNGDVDSADLTVKFVDSNDEDDFDGDIDEAVEDIDINAGETLTDDEIVIKFDVPAKAKEGTYELVVKFEGKDDNNAEHTLEWKLDLEVDREKDDVRVEKAYLVTDALVCGVDSTQLKVTMTNFGSNTQKDAALKIHATNKDLKVDHMFKDIYLDEDVDEEDNSYSKTVTISRGDLKAGDYDIYVTAYVDNDNEVDGTYVTLKVEDCQKEAGDYNKQLLCEKAGFYWYDGDCHEEKKESPAVVVNVCGNGLVESGEDCDDGNYVTGDGCSSLCKTEVGSLITGGGVIDTVEIPFTQIKGIVVFMGVITALLVVLIILVIYSLTRKR